MRKGTRKPQKVLVAAFATAFLLVVTGCAAHHAYLVPAPAATLANAGHAALGTANGIEIEAIPNAWNGKPADLPDTVTPLKVRIENHSKEPLRLVYDDFQIETANGKTLAALPPAEIKGSQYVGRLQYPDAPRYVPAPDPQKKAASSPARTKPDTIVLRPGFDYYDFYYAPYWGFGYAGLNPWPTRWLPDWAYYNSYYPYMKEIHLPTRSMLRKAIPEGVIKPGGYVEGFLYFKKINPIPKRVEFVARLQNANTGRQFGQVQIPFKVESK